MEAVHSAAISPLPATPTQCAQVSRSLSKSHALPPTRRELAHSLPSLPHPTQRPHADGDGWENVPARVRRSRFTVSLPCSHHQHAEGGVEAPLRLGLGPPPLRPPLSWERGV